jgi:hypothetical protein
MYPPSRVGGGGGALARLHVGAMCPHAGCMTGLPTHPGLLDGIHSCPLRAGFALGRALNRYNEPDRADQANTRPPEAAQAWHVLERVAEKYNLTLGSPAIGSVPSWQDDFIQVHHASCHACIMPSFGRAMRSMFAQLVPQ